MGRDTDKRWMFERWLVTNKPVSVPTLPATTEAAKTRAQTWAVAIEVINLSGSAMQFFDKAGSKPVAFNVDAVNAQLNGLTLDENSSTRTVVARLMPMSASLRLTTGRFEPSKLNFKGKLGLTPIQVQGRLLADRHGVIDMDLPLSGSLNDPQFSIGPIIIKIILHVIVKAVTAPFSSLASVFGGGSDELGAVAFPSKSATLLPDAKVGLDKVAKALTDRPSLKLTVVGARNLEAERDGYKRVRLDQLVRPEKRRSVATGGGTATAFIMVDPAEYAALLEDYKRADIAKPRSLIGLAKDLPSEDIEQRLLADIKVNQDAMQALALQRGVAVKEYLASKDLPLERLFLGSTHSGKSEAKTDVKTDAKTQSPWVPRAELGLAM